MKVLLTLLLLNLFTSAISQERKQTDAEKMNLKGKIKSIHNKKIIKMMKKPKHFKGFKVQFQYASFTTVDHQLFPTMQIKIL